MQEFWYHSPVRFYKTYDETLDMLNPQNAQYFGGNYPYPLQIAQFHKFMLPNINNTVSVAGTDLSLWMVCQYTSQRVPARFGVIDGKLIWVVLASYDILSGHLEIRTSTGSTLFYSNPVTFMDSTDFWGRQFIRIATKHGYPRFNFDYSDPQDWTITNVPAFELGEYTVDAEISNTRTGGLSTLVIKDSYVDEVVTYEALSEGDSNILAFLQVYATNSLFFINGTQRTLVDKMDRGDFAMNGKFKFANVKNPDGTNIVFDEDAIFEQLLTPVLATEDYSPIDFNNILIMTQ